jgi:hypothetical protein
LEGFVKRNGESSLAVYLEDRVISCEQIIEVLDSRRSIEGLLKVIVKVGKESYLRDTACLMSFLRDRSLIEAFMEDTGGRISQIKYKIVFVIWRFELQRKSTSVFLKRGRV